MSDPSAGEAPVAGASTLPHFDPVLIPVVQAAALRAERIVSISRVVFCTLVLARFLVLEHSTLFAPYVLNLSALGLTIGYSLCEVMMFLFVLGSVVVLSVSTARRTLELVAAGASATLQVDRARGKLAELVREHHDARSVISAAALSSDMMMRAMAIGTGPSDPLRSEEQVRRHAERLREDLEAARRQLAQLGEKAYLELTALARPERVATTRVIEEAASSLRLRFPDLALETDLEAGRDLVIVGGAASIQRILYNLVSNAREGDGHIGASRVSVRAESRAGVVTLVVEDDGPGFGEAVLSRAGSLPATTKPDGMGLGLVMTSELVRLSGGTVRTDNRPGGGGRLRVTLPAATAER